MEQSESNQDPSELYEERSDFKSLSSFKDPFDVYNHEPLELDDCLMQRKSEAFEADLIRPGSPLSY